MISILERLMRALEEGGPEEMKRLADSLTEDEHQQLIEEILDDETIAETFPIELIIEYDFKRDLIIGFSVN